MGLGASSRVALRWLGASSGNVFQSPDMTAWKAVFVKVRKGELCISAPGYSELGENAVHDHQVITGERSSQFEQKVLLLPG